MQNGCEECTTEQIYTDAIIVMRGRHLCAAHALVFLIDHIIAGKAYKLDDSKAIIETDM